MIITETKIKTKLSTKEIIRQAVYKLKGRYSINNNGIPFVQKTFKSIEYGIFYILIDNIYVVTNNIYNKRLSHQERYEFENFDDVLKFFNMDN